MAGTETLVITVAMRRFMKLFSTPYGSGSKSLLPRVLENVKGALNLFISEDVNIFFKWYHGVYLGMIVVLTVYLVFNWKKLQNRDRILTTCAAFILVAYQAGWIGFYNTTLWTYTRGISVGLLFFASAKRKRPLSCFCCSAVQACPM